MVRFPPCKFDSYWGSFWSIKIKYGDLIWYTTTGSLKVGTREETRHVSIGRWYLIGNGPIKYPWSLSYTGFEKGTFTEEEGIRERETYILGGYISRLVFLSK